MLQAVVGIFLILHGVVHLLYFGHSARFFELKPGMTWPDGAWVFSRFLDDSTIRNVASIALIVAALAFALSGIGVFINQEWWRTVAEVAAVFSTVLYLLLWNGTTQNMDGQGWVGILINVVILVALLVLHWPPVGF